MHWVTLRADGWKLHVVQAYYEGCLRQDLTARPENQGETPDWESKSITTMSIDMPGMVHMDRPWSAYFLDGLAIEIPCEDVATFIHRLDALKERTFKTHYRPGDRIQPAGYIHDNGVYKSALIEPDGTFKEGEILATGDEPGYAYYKLHGFACCLVLTPDQRMLLLEQMRADVHNAEARATAFYVDKVPAAQVLQEANAVAHGLPRDAYKDKDFGGHKNDRFHIENMKKGGDA